jgi:hypothetical protein
VEEERIPTFIPGDQIKYCLVFTCKANIRHVSATFRNQETGSEIVLTGEAYPSEQTKIIGTRVHEAQLFNNNDLYESADPGRYRLARLEATTYSGHSLDFDNPSEGIGFNYRDEPTDDLPKLARGVVDPPDWFVLPKSHPNSPHHWFGG